MNKKWLNALCIISLLIIHNAGAIADNFIRAHSLHKQELFDQALLLFNDLCNQEPKNSVYHFSRAGTLLALGNMQEAIQEYDCAFQLNPQMIEALYNKGYALKTNGQLDEAIAVYQKLLALNPNHHGAQLSLGFTYLAAGDFARGWPQHEKHLKRSDKNSNNLRRLLKNDQIKGKNIALSYEGGLGDTLQFIRYAQLLHNKGAHITVVAQKPLIPLLSLCPYIDRLVTDQKAIKNCFDATATLMSLPAIFNHDQTTLPKEIPYLFADKKNIQEWENSFDKHYFNIGICWQASVENDRSRLPLARRGISLPYFFQLAQPAVRFYSLQQEDGLDQLANSTGNFNLNLFGPDFDKKNGAFVDTAAVMHHLDLIITIDSAVAHLAGALGKKVWLLLPFATDWRWINGHTDSPWYPSMRIFKQPKPFDWQSVIQEVNDELKKPGCVGALSKNSTQPYF
jgi:tetratricopeptide (TPR) repeat protein